MTLERIAHAAIAEQRAADRWHAARTQGYQAQYAAWLQLVEAYEHRVKLCRKHIGQLPEPEDQTITMWED